MMELSSLVASVTLRAQWLASASSRSGTGETWFPRLYVHELVGLLLLLQNGRRSIIFL